MSIAGIAKEVTTITISAWFFGDELTPLNITGVAITICGGSPLHYLFFRLVLTVLLGIALFTYHKYQKSLDSSIQLDGHGNPVESSELEDGAYLELNQNERQVVVNQSDLVSLLSDDSLRYYSNR